jgi:DNA-binding NarL/FixJ family response regulator
MTIRVVVGEDNFLVREGIASVLAEIEGVELVESAGDLDELRDAVERTAPNVVLTDIRMPPTNTDEGVRLADELRTSHPEVGVVVLSQHAEPWYAIALFKGGSDRRAYLLKERLKDQHELGRALHNVAEGQSLVDPRIVDKLITRDRLDSELHKLTPRELEVLGLIAEGLSNQAIGERLSMSKRAVERHINAIFMKLDLGEPETVSRRVRAAMLFLNGELV